VLTVPGSDTIYAADAIMTATYTLWSVDCFVASFSFGIVGGRVIWILSMYLAEEGAGRKESNSVKDVREALTLVPPSLPPNLFLADVIFYSFSTVRLGGGR